MRRIYRGTRGAGEMKGRKTLRRAGIVLAFGALLSAGMLASGALGMTLDGGTRPDSSSTATDTTTTDAAPSTSTSADTTAPTSTETVAPTTTDTTSSTTTTTPAPFAPAISTDQFDYVPGSTVTLIGSGWGPGAAVHILVNDNVGQTWSYSADVTADATGGFTNQFQLPDWFIATYTATATGSGATVTTTFTDGNFVVALKGVPNGTTASFSWTKYS